MDALPTPSDFALLHGAEIEAFILASPDPVTEAQVAARIQEGSSAAALLRELAERTKDRAVRLVRDADGWRYAVDPAFLPEALKAPARKARELSEAALATLAFVALYEPVTLAEIERGRGVKVSRALLDKLMEAGMIRPGIRRTGTGRAATYSTTDAFLAHFRLDALSDMPTPEELLSRDLPVDTPE
ncbi:chromosome segregation protein ScpB [Methylorubrum populi]|nr:chromosome segregation protein ScpB [Methylorubrum populi]